MYNILTFTGRYFILEYVISSWLEYVILQEERPNLDRLDLTQWELEKDSSRLILSINGLNLKMEVK